MNIWSSYKLSESRNKWQKYGTLIKSFLRYRPSSVSSKLDASSSEENTNVVSVPLK